MKKANRDEGQNISALHPYLKCFFDKSLILYTYENPCELASSVDYPRSRIPQIFPSNKALKNFCRKKVKKRTVFLSKTVLLVVAGEIFIKYADEFFPFLFGREGSFDQKGAYLSIV